jgi:hypothetical protein
VTVVGDVVAALQSFIRRQWTRSDEMRFMVGWGRDDDLPDGQPRVPVQSVEELDAVLDRLEHERGVDGAPYLVEVTDLDSGDGFITYHLQLSTGHAERATLHFIGEPAGGIGYEPGLPPWTGGVVAFDENGELAELGADRLRVTAAVAREAAREYLRTGQRPTCVEWDGARTGTTR